MMEKCECGYTNKGECMLCEPDEVPPKILKMESTRNLTNRIMKRDIIHNTTTTHFDFIDRLKILIGGKAITDLEIETGNDIVLVEGSNAKTYVQYPDWINRLRYKFRRYQGGEVEHV